ncbi:MAG: HD domain-containing protein [Clostridia bacterium]|nr:HD domain-containing protein [Clostridia bacterium]
MNERFTTMRALNGSLAEALNMIDPSMENHHQQTAYLSYMIARAADFNEHALALTRTAALTHDIGLITTEKTTDISESKKNAEQMAQFSADIIEEFLDSAEVANIVRYCHSSWSKYLSYTKEEQGKYCESARIATVVHLADTVSTMLKADVSVLNQAKEIRETISTLRDKEFSAEAVDAFLRASENEFIWLDLRYNPQFLNFFVGDIEAVSLDRTVKMTAIMSYIIDFHSSFTAMHSAGVAASASELARLAGMSEDECKMMKIAGQLHDVGKLRVPRTILEKPDKLTEEEFNIIKEHPYYTRLNMMNVEGFEKIRNWAGYHHEKLNGRGYPFHLNASSLDTGSRIMAVADIFSAISEKRPYREGMNSEQVLKELNNKVRLQEIDGDIVTLLAEHFEETERLRENASKSEVKRYYETINKI